MSGIRVESCRADPSVRSIDLHHQYPGPINPPSNRQPRTVQWRRCDDQQLGWAERAVDSAFATKLPAVETPPLVKRQGRWRHLKWISHRLQFCAE